jgi:hypothetical protein
MLLGAPPGLGLVRARRLVAPSPTVRFALRPGDRVLVSPGSVVTPGARLAELARQRQVVEGTLDGAAGSPGSWTDALNPGRRRSRGGTTPLAGELLYRLDRRWGAAVGSRWDPLEAPAAGIVRAVRPGMELLVAVDGQGLLGRVVVGGPVRGRLGLLAGDGDAPLGPLDVRWAGGIVFVGSRVEAEGLIRARAMGIRGVVVGSLGAAALRDLAASEARQRTAMEATPPFAVLVLDGALRRPLPSPILSLLGRLAGREVAIVGDPPALLFDLPPELLPVPPAELVRVRWGPAAGREGRWVVGLGPRRFPGGIVTEGALVAFDDGETAVVPLGDLERFV